MKLDKILDTATKTFVKMKLGGKKIDPKLAALDRGVLTVALLVAALDGTILPEEYAAFRLLAEKCRGGTAKNARALLDAALPDVGRLMAMAQVGVYSTEERLVAFLTAAKKALPRGFANGSMADLRRAFALWVMMGSADGAFSAVEESAVRVLLRRLTIVRAKKGERGKSIRCQLLEDGFLQKAADIARDLAAPSRRTKAEAALEALISYVPMTDDKGETSLAPACGIALRLAVMALLGTAAVGTAKADADGTLNWDLSDGDEMDNLRILEPR